MSKAIDDVVFNIKNNGDLFNQIDSSSIGSPTIKITQFGNTYLLSVIKIEINGKRFNTTYMDCYKLEKAVRYWFKNVKLKQLLTNN